MGCGMLTGLGLLQQPYGCNGGILPTFKVTRAILVGGQIKVYADGETRTRKA